MEGKPSSRKARRLVRVYVVATIGLVLAVVAALPAPARAEPPVSRIALMAFGSFAGPAAFPSFGAQVACTSFNGCVGLVGFPFPGFVLRETVTGSFVCTPSDNPTQCTVSVVSADVACDLTTSAAPTPGLSNPVHIDCAQPKGSGDGLTTLNLLI